MLKIFAYQGRVLLSDLYLRVSTKCFLENIYVLYSILSTILLNILLNILLYILLYILRPYKGTPTMITLQYLKELGTFTLDLIFQVKQGEKLQYLDLRGVGNELYMYRYNDINMLGTIGVTNPLSDTEIISINSRNESKLSIINLNFVEYKNNLKQYTDVSFEEDFFAVSTALSDSEIIELYLVRTVQDMLISTYSTDRIVINTELLHEYYTVVKPNE